MQVFRTVLWIVLTIFVGLFVAMNVHKAPVNFWPLGEGKQAHLDWPVGFTALFFFFLGMVPTWLMLRTTRWRLKRRIQALEDSIRAITSNSSETAEAVLPEKTDDSEETSPTKTES